MKKVKTAWQTPERSIKITVRGASEEEYRAMLNDLSKMNRRLKKAGKARFSYKISLKS